MKKLEVGKDYIAINNNNYIVIDRVGGAENKGFYGGTYMNNLLCIHSSGWREATEEEVIEAFKKHLVRRYGEDWETMKIKERHPAIVYTIDRSWRAHISKDLDGWNVWNRNGLVYCNGIWVRR